MISARQVSNILAKSFSGGDSNFLRPTASFNAVASNYLENPSPDNVILSGYIQENDGENISWVIKDNNNNNILSGISYNPSVTLTTPPTTVGTYVYTLYITYDDKNGVSQPAIIKLATVTVSTPAFVGKLATAGDVLTEPSHLTTAIESTLTSLTSAQVINKFTISDSQHARIVIVVPNSYGVVLRIEDNTDTDTISNGQFKVVNDTAKNRTIYVSDNAISEGDWRFKIIF